MQIIPLTYDVIDNKWTLIKSIEEKSGLTPLWNKINFQSNLPYKWDLSKLLVLGSTILGYAIISEKTSVCAHLHRIVILKEYQCKGYGSYFIDDIILNLQKKYKFCTLKVCNKRTQTFYEKKGFHPIFSSAGIDYMILCRKHD